MGLNAGDLFSAVVIRSGVRIRVKVRDYQSRQHQLILTTLVGADRDDRHRTRERTHVRDAVEGLDLEGVVGVGREVGDSDGAVGEAQRPREET